MSTRKKVLLKMDFFEMVEIVLDNMITKECLEQLTTL